MIFVHAKACTKIMTTDIVGTRYGVYELDVGACHVQIR